MKKIIVTTLLTMTFVSTAGASCIGPKTWMTCFGDDTSVFYDHAGSSARPIWSHTTIGDATYGISNSGVARDIFINGLSGWTTDHSGNMWNCWNCN